MQNISKHNCSNKYKEYDYISHIKIYIWTYIPCICYTIVSRNVSTNVFYSNKWKRKRLIFTLICIVLHIKLEIKIIVFIISTFLSSFFSILFWNCECVHVCTLVNLCWLLCFSSSCCWHPVCLPSTMSVCDEELVILTTELRVWLKPFRIWWN